MKIRVFDIFDPNFTCVIWEGVDYVDNDGTVYFEDGTYENIDTQFQDWEEVEK